MIDFAEGDKVDVLSSNSGYTGPAKVIGHIFGQTWLVQALDERQRLLSVLKKNLKKLADAAPTPNHKKKK